MEHSSLIPEHSSLIPSILHPEEHVLRTLGESRGKRIAPVHYRIWKGGPTIELELDALPYDTIDTLTHRLVHAMHSTDDRAYYTHRHLFLGIPVQNERGATVGLYPLDYLWFSPQSDRPSDAFVLPHPKDALHQTDSRFVTSNGTLKPLTLTTRGRLTIEQLFLRADTATSSKSDAVEADEEQKEPKDVDETLYHLPVIEVVPFHYLYQAFQLQRRRQRVGPKETTSLTDAEFNGMFYPYFPELTLSALDPVQDDKDYADMMTKYMDGRNHAAELLQQIMNAVNEEIIELPSIQLEGIGQILFTWKKPKTGIVVDGCADVFYRVPVTKNRPFMRLLPGTASAAAGITKLHVEGVIPIPTLMDPMVLEQWAKEESNTPDIDFCIVKYVQRILHGVPYYGTVHLMNDGSMNLMLQPTWSQKMVERDVFEDMEENMEDHVLSDLSYSLEDMRLHEMNAVIQLTIPSHHVPFTGAMLEKRLSLFRDFFVKIQPVLPPNQHPILSLRYKAMSQYEVQNKVMVYISQFMGNVIRQNEAAVGPAGAGAEAEEAEVEAAAAAASEMSDPLMVRLLRELQDEFQMSKTKALAAIQEYVSRKQEFTVKLPKEGEFITTFHPGIDIYIYKNHPHYTVHIHRIESEESYERICMMLRYLLIDESTMQEYLVPAKASDAKEWDKLDKAQAMGSNKREEALLEENEEALLLEEDEEEEIKEQMKRTGLLEKKAAAAASAAASDEKGRADEEEVDVSPFGYLLKRLQAADPYLFGSQKLKIDSKYSTRCQISPQKRQPVVMTKEEFEQMQERYRRYEDDGLIHWRIYPIVGDKNPERVPNHTTVFTVMRYASPKKVLHYYMCPEYFCILDNVVLLPEEFRGEKRLLDGSVKRPNTCPFCGNGLIVETRMRKKGHHTVIHRPPEPRKPLQQYIGFLKRDGDEIAKPCCFGKEQVLRGEDEEGRFEHLREALGMRSDDTASQSSMSSRSRSGKAGLRDLGGIPIADAVINPYKIIDYAQIFRYEVQTGYMLDANKDPDPGRIALISPVFDAFFQQNSAIQMIERGKNAKPSLKSTATGFLRVGVDNTVYESLLGAIAPILGESSIQGVKDVIQSVVRPSVFANVCFGNYVMEFFSPTDDQAMPMTQQELRQWAATELDIELSSTNQHALLRLYNAYYRFLQFLADPNQRKDLRHLQPLLAEPGLFTENGLQLVMMDVKDKRVVIKCPTYGLSDHHRKSDFIFLSREFRVRDTIVYPHYEYYIYSVGRPAKGEKSEKHRVIQYFSYERSELFAPIVRERIDEYMKQCRSFHRAIYSEQHLPHLHPLAMIPLSSILHVFPAGSPTHLSMIVKDVSNHVAGILVTDRTAGKGLIPVPVVDDGVNTMEINDMAMELNWRSVHGLAATETILRFYHERMRTVYRSYQGYRVTAVVRRRRDGPYVAIQLANGLYVPVGPVESEEKFRAMEQVYRESDGGDGGDGILVKIIDEWEWEMNLEFLGQLDAEETFEKQTQPMAMEEKCKEKPDTLLEDKSIHAFEEYYQTFRLMVSNWLTSSKTGEGIRDTIQSIVFDATLPDYERRYRLYVLLADEFRGMLQDTRDPNEPPVLSLYRRDCRLIGNPEQCTEMCAWNNERGKCLLHVRRETPITDDRTVNTSEMYTKRVIDELVRFPHRRKQLMYHGEISRMIRMEDPLRIQDQYYIPESSFTWTTLLRLEWTKQTMERPRHYEEMTRIRDDSDTGPETDFMPPVCVGYLATLQREDAPLLPILYKKITSSQQTEEPLYPLMSVVGVEWDRFGITEEEQRTLRQLKPNHYMAYTVHTQQAIGWVDLNRPEEPRVHFVRHDQRMTQQDTQMILHYRDQGVRMTGMFLNSEGGSILLVETFPPAWREAWEKATVVSSKVIPKPVPALDQLLQPKVEGPYLAPMSMIPMNQGVKRELAPPVIKKVRDPRGRPTSEALVAPHLKGVDLDQLDPVEHVQRKPRVKKVYPLPPKTQAQLDREAREAAEAKKAAEEKEEDAKRRDYQLQAIREEEEQKTEEQRKKEIQEKRRQLRASKLPMPSAAALASASTDAAALPKKSKYPMPSAAALASVAASASTDAAALPKKSKYPLPSAEALSSAAAPKEITGKTLIDVARRIEAKKHRVPRLAPVPEEKKNS